MTSPAPYTRAEIKALGNQLPDRGTFCPACGLYIPEFADLTPEERAELKQVSFFETIKTLRSRTGCRLTWAKIWAQHKDGPHPLATPDTVPCRFCGVPLHPEAGQCLLCRMDWHDPEHLKQLGPSFADQILSAAPGATICLPSHTSWILALHFAAMHGRQDELTIEFMRRNTD